MTATDHAPQFVYFGCYTAGEGGSGTGIGLAGRDRRTGELSSMDTVAETPSPSFLTRHPSLPVLYAANELAEGSVSGFTVAPDGGLTPLGSAGTGGSHPCHLSVHPSGRFLFSANYASGSIAVHPLGPAGEIGERVHREVHSGHGPRAYRQEGPHAHMVTPAADGDLLAVDLGLDRLYRYQVGPDGRLTVRFEVAARPGSGPRHVVADRAGFAYLAGELDTSVTTYLVGDEGWREHASVSAGTSGQPSEIALSADGSRLYLANRGPDTIVVWSVERGRLTPMAEVPSGGAWPRHFALVDGYLYVANERSPGVTAFRLDETGVPVQVGEPLPVGSPTCVLPW